MPKKLTLKKRLSIGFSNLLSGATIGVIAKTWGIEWGLAAAVALVLIMAEIEFGLIEERIS